MTRKKIRRMRGSRRHGYGKHHRGKGNRGGRGNAGRGKRGGQKKPSYREQPLGKHGFKTVQKTFHKAITFRDIEDRLDTWLAHKLVHEENGLIVVDLKKLGFTKLLSQGRLTRKLKIHVPSASKKAVDKIKAAGGAPV